MKVLITLSCLIINVIILHCVFEKKLPFDVINSCQKEGADGMHHQLDLMVRVVEWQHTFYVYHTNTFFIQPIIYKQEIVQKKPKNQLLINLILLSRFCFIFNYFSSFLRMENESILISYINES